jgi:hypothetical protein
MTGGNLVVISLGAKDVYLSGNPQTTYFKSIYKRHTPFAIYRKELNCEGVPKFGNKVTYNFGNDGDLFKNIHLELEVPGLKQVQNSSTYVGFVNSFLATTIDYIEITFDVQIIDKIYGQQLDIANELYLEEGKRIGQDNMMGKYQSNLSLQTNATNDNYFFTIDIPFWFKENCMAVPLIALQYTEVKVNIQFKKALACVVSDVSLENVLDKSDEQWEISACRLYSDYITLSPEERKFFAQKNHEYLITQHQYNNDFITSNTINKTINLSFENPIRYLHWVIQNIPTTNTDISSATGNKWNVYEATGGGTSMSSAILRLNGMNYQDSMNYNYYLNMIPYQYFNNIPRKYIYSYSFSLDPLNWKPSGQVNFSKFDKKELIITTPAISNDRRVNIYATNYNVLRIASGIGSLAFT